MYTITAHKAKSFIFAQGSNEYGGMAMRLRLMIGIGPAVLLGATAIATTILKARNNQNNKQTEGLQVPVVVKQLPSENGLIPVELRCGMAHLSAPNTLEKFSCVVKNNGSMYFTQRGGGSGEVRRKRQGITSASLRAASLSLATS
ncbi:MAG TPA: hypothetical protein VG148_18385 [Pyrinomonadaceae bacterium]|nr:hypothetical protein [Pyrinomonadaceae bacterium]